MMTRRDDPPGFLRALSRVQVGYAAALGAVMGLAFSPEHAWPRLTLASLLFAVAAGALTALLVRRTLKRPRRKAVRRVCIVYCFLAIVTAPALLHAPGTRYVGLPGAWLDTVVLLSLHFLFLLCAGAYFVWLHRIHFLETHPWLCRTCGYDLRGSADRCPECGNAVSEAAPEAGYPGIVDPQTGSVWTGAQ